MTMIAEELNTNAIQRGRRGPCLHLGSAVSLLQGCVLHPSSPIKVDCPHHAR